MIISRIPGATALLRLWPGPPFQSVQRLGLVASPVTR